MNRGVIKIDDEFILKWLQFDGGKIIGLRRDEFADTIEILIEHPEMPEHSSGAHYETIRPMYDKYTDNQGNSVTIRQPLG